MTSMFSDAKLEQKYIKLLVYGPEGSGKSLTSMDIADGICKKLGGGFAVIQNEQSGTEWYSVDRKERRLHPKAFRYQICKTESMVEAKKAVIELMNNNSITVILIDSLTKYYENAKKLYGKLTKASTIAINSWNKIYKEYGDFVKLILSCDKHVICTSRSANVFETSSKDDDKQVKTGTQARVGKDAAYEFQTVLRFGQRLDSNNDPIIYCHGEKDRSSTLQGKVIDWPSFDLTIKHILPFLSKEHGVINDTVDSDKFSQEVEDTEFEINSESIKNEFYDKIKSCENLTLLRDIGEQIKTVSVKLTDTDRGFLAELYTSTLSLIKKGTKTERNILEKTDQFKPPM